MEFSDSQPRFEARPAGLLGEGWSVHVFWASKKSGVITGFPTQYEALDWIKHKSANWVVDKILDDPGL
jgi:hypothetical protein